MIKSTSNIDQFEQWKKQNNIQFITPEQQLRRRDIFYENLKKINQLKNCSACGVNYLTALSQEEFQSLLTLKTVESNESKKNPEYRLSDVQLLHEKQNIQTADLNNLKVSNSGQNSSYPSALNWADKGMVTGAKNQGNCGSCWSFATTAMTQSYALIKGVPNVTLNVDLSQQYLLECTDGGSCDGGWIADAMNKVIDGQGIPSESSFAYDPNNFHKGICNAPRAIANPSSAFTQHYSLTDDQMIEILQNGPMNIAVAALNWNKYNPSVTKIFQCFGDETVDHAVMLVGYTSDAWIIKNSWGPEYGVNGYIWVSRNRTGKKSCQVGFYGAAFVLTKCNIDYCAKCQTNNQHSCDTCDVGYYQAYGNSTSTNNSTLLSSNDFICVACKDVHCENCYNYRYDMDHQGVCYLCRYEYSLDYQGNYSCADFSGTNLSFCKYHFYKNKSPYCYECWNGYIRSSNYESCLRCQVTHCTLCQINQPSKCQTCEEGYQGQNCQPKICSEHCKSGCTQNGVCDECEAGYSGSDCSIIQCNIQHCIKGCSSPNICEQCDSGFTGPTCTAVYQCSIAHCSSGCIGDNVCGKCDPGYTGDKCDKIICLSSVKNCNASCLTDPRICSQCNQGFYGPQCDMTYDDISNCKKNSSKSSTFDKTSTSSFYKEVSTSTNYQQQSYKKTIKNLIISLSVISASLVISWLIFGIYTYRKIQQKRILFYQTQLNDRSASKISDPNLSPQISDAKIDDNFEQQINL